MREPWLRTLWVVWFAELIAIMGMSLVIPFLPLYLAQDLHVPASQARLWAGFVGGANFLCAALIAPFWGSLADRRGRKPMALRALLGLALAVGLMGLAQTPYQLFALRLLQGAVGGFVAAAIALVGTAVPREKLGAALGFLQTAMVGGNLVGPLAGGFLSEHYGFRRTFWITCGALLFAALLLYLLVQEEYEPTAAAAESSYLSNFRLLAAMPSIRLLFGVMFLTQAGMMLMNTQFSLFVLELLGPNAANVRRITGLVAAAPAVTSFLAAPLWGRAGDRRGHRWVLGAALLGAGGIYPWGALATQWWQVFALRMGLGGFTCAVPPAAHSVVAHSVDEHRTAGAFSLLASAQMLGSAAGPFLGGPLAQWLGIRPLFPLTAALLVVAGLGGRALERQAPALAKADSTPEPAGAGRS